MIKCISTPMAMKFEPYIFPFEEYTDKTGTDRIYLSTDLVIVVPEDAVTPETLDVVESEVTFYVTPPRTGDMFNEDRISEPVALYEVVVSYHTSDAVTLSGLILANDISEELQGMYVEVERKFIANYK